jgi:isoleucyl-tRNA synthetase
VIVREALPDVVVMSEGPITVALDTEIDTELLDEGLMREALSLLQRLRKSKGLEVTDRIKLRLITNSPELKRALEHHQIYLVSELLADELNILESTKAPGDYDELLVEDELLWAQIDS